MQYNGACLSPKQNMSGSNFIENSKHTTENKDAPRITHKAGSNKNIAHGKITCCFLLMKRVCLGNPQALTLEPLGYFLGCPGDIPKLELLCILHPMASFFSSNT